MDPNHVPPKDIKLTSGEVGTLKHELSRFEKEGTCRMCQVVFGFALLIFLLTVTLFLYAQKGVPPSVIIPVKQVPRETPLTRKEEGVIMDDLRQAAKAEKHYRTTTILHEEDGPSTIP